MQSNSTDLFGSLPTKRCKICKQQLPLDSFYLLLKKTGRSYRNSYCKDCGNKKRRQYKQSPRPGQNYIRQRNLKSYGLTVDQYDEMLTAQGGVCAICNLPETHVSSFTKKIRRLSIDHDHKTGKIRGLLCSSCNRAIGLLGDDAERIKAVLTYLEKST